MGSAFADLRGNGLPLRERRRRHLIELGVLADDPDDDEEDDVTTEVAELNGSAVVATTEPAPEPDAPTRSCRGCGMELRGKAVQVWCSGACRKRHTRSAPKAQVVGGSRGTSPLVPAPLVAVQTDFFAQATALAALFPVGAHLERTGPGEICLRWPA